MSPTQDHRADRRWLADWNNDVGVDHLRGGRLEQADAAFREAIRLEPLHVEAISNRGALLQARGKIDEAVACFREALRIRPDNGVARDNLAGLLLASGRVDEAIDEYRVAIRLRTDDSASHCNLGLALHARGRLDEAEAECRAAIRLQPGAAPAHGGLGAILVGRDELDGAIAEFRAALVLEPEDVTTMRNLAATLDLAARPAEAMAAFDDVLRIDPTDSGARAGRGYARLALGDFRGGWRDFEAGHDTPRAHALEAPSVPTWRGEGIAGTLLLNGLFYGAGDCIQAARFAAQARRRTGGTVLLARPELARLMARCPGIDRVVTDRAELPPVAAQAHVWSLPSIFNVTPETMATDGPYLGPDPATAERWRPKLAEVPGFRVGVAWQGNPAHCNDRRRSFRLAELAPLADVPGVALVSLQKGYGTDQIATAGFPMVDLGPDYAAGDMLDAAGVMQHLDLVISADTGLAHLAGATGRRTWLALSRAVEWRWMLDRDDSPWYPSVRLFRQSGLGDWRPVFRRMADELRRIA